MPKFSNLIACALGLTLLLAWHPSSLMAAEKTKIPPHVVSALQQANVPLNAVSILITPLAARRSKQANSPTTASDASRQCGDEPRIGHETHHHNGWLVDLGP
jgi:hypothetical protein